MPVQASALGQELTPVTVDVTTRMTLAFPAAIADVGPRTSTTRGQSRSCSALLLRAPVPRGVMVVVYTLMPRRRGPQRGGWPNLERAVSR
jgi:hypothetical protein